MKDDDPPSDLYWSPAEPRFCTLLQRLAAESPSVFVVGGAVRDAMHRRVSKQAVTSAANSALLTPPTHVASVPNNCPTDLDVALPLDACKTARRVADELGWAFYKLDAERDIARLVDTESTPHLVCDVARFQGETLAEDLACRDFSINAMAFQVQLGTSFVTLFDQHGGLSDLATQRIRRVNSHSLLQDSIRLLRAVRFAAQFRFDIESETRRQIVMCAPAIAESSPERVRDELWKLLATRQPDRGIEELRKVGLLRWILPEVNDLIDVPQSAPHHLDVYQHTLLAVHHAGFLRDWLLRDNIEEGLDYTENSPTGLLTSSLQTWQAKLRRHYNAELAVGHRRQDWLVWLALLHDIGKPNTITEERIDNAHLRYRFFDHEEFGAQLTSDRLQTLHFSKEEVKFASRSVAGHMHPHHLNTSFASTQISRRACYRFYRKLGQIQSDSLVGIDVVLLALADRWAIPRYLNLPTENPSANSSTVPSGEAASIEAASIETASIEANRPNQIDSALESWNGYLSHMNQLLAYGFDAQGIPAMGQPRLLDGNQLINRFGLEPGPELGTLLEQLAEAQAAGEINTVDEAFSWVADIIRNSD